MYVTPEGIFKQLYIFVGKIEIIFRVLLLGAWKNYAPEASGF